LDATGAAKQDDQQPGGKRIERSRVTGFGGAKLTTNVVCHFVRTEASRFVDEDYSVHGSSRTVR
jgi:hypothetical protein